jgi:DNA primase
MALYTQQSRERVRDAVDFVEVVAARTELRRAGPSRYEGLCPFHDERTPSFGIDPAQKVYYCFGCQASGDLFTFVEETEGVDFKGALELLADRFGVELELERENPKDAERRRRKDRLLGLLERTAGYYERRLWEATEARQAREYLTDRGLGEQVLRLFRVGHAPSAWDRVLLGSRQGGFSEQELYAAGLAQCSQENGRPYDRFRGRLMFPLADIRGRVLGFGARALRDNQQPKYLNTSDNEVYHKGSHLYGAHIARIHATRAGEVILCEGYTDVIALHQAGFQNAVGLMGTALTADQLGELARMASTLLLALDADSAGREAMLRAQRVARSRKLELRVVELPGGADPAELLQRDGPEAMSAAVESSVPVVRFQVERVLAAGDEKSPEGRDKMLEQLRPIFATLAPSAMRMELTRLVSGRLELPESLAERLLAANDRGSTNATGELAGGRGPAGRERAAAGVPAGARREHDPSTRVREALGRREETERTFLALCIASPELGSEALGAIEIDEHFTSELLRRAAAHLRDGRLQKPMGGIGDGDAELSGLLAELVVEAGSEQAKPVMFEVQRLQLELARIERQIRGARAGDGSQVSELAMRRAELKHEFDLAQEVALQETGS